MLLCRAAAQGVLCSVNVHLVIPGGHQRLPAAPGEHAGLVSACRDLAGSNTAIGCMTIMLLCALGFRTR